MEYNHESKKGIKKVTVDSETHTNFVNYRHCSGWNTRAIMELELDALNEEMKRQGRKVALTICLKIYQKKYGTPYFI